MEDGTYVKLTKEQHSLQEITPGELNQPIDVAAINAPRCEHCGQTLPPSYSPPADEDWVSGIFGCNEDRDSCKSTLISNCKHCSSSPEILLEYQCVHCTSGADKGSDS